MKAAGLAAANVTAENGIAGASRYTAISMAITMSQAMAARMPMSDLSLPMQISNAARFLRRDTHVLDEIALLLSDDAVENGGILGVGDNAVYFERDPMPFHSGINAYAPNTEYLNALLHRWKSRDIEFIGFAHSHPNGREKLSEADVKYAKRILRHFPSDGIMMMLVARTPDFRIRITCQVVDELCVRHVFSASRRDSLIKAPERMDAWKFET